MKLLISLVMFPLFIFAANQRSAKALKTEFRNGKFTATLAEGFHFNDKAPNGVQAGEVFFEPSTFSARNLVVTNVPQNTKDAEATLYVCDDQVTFCEVHSFPLGTSSSQSKPNAATKITQEKDKHGFYSDFEQGLKVAQKNKQNVFVEFGARWCPPCLRLESEIFNKPDFKKMTKAFVKIKVDVDKFQNSILLKKYNIEAFPTLVFMTPEGQEITRFLDYQPMSYFKMITSEVTAHPFPIQTLESRANDTSKNEILWARYYRAGQYASALNLMEGLTTKPKEYWSAKVELARTKFVADTSKKSDYINTLKAALKEESNTSRSIYWRKLLADLYEEGSLEVKALADQSNKLVTLWNENPKALKKATETDSLGESTGYEAVYVNTMNAELAEAAKLDHKKAWAKVLEQGKESGITPKQTGPALRLLTAYYKTENYEEALKWVRNLLKEKPTDGDLQRREMRTLLELKRFKEAVKVGEQALKNSYGINEFFVVEPLAKAYAGLGQNQKAKELISKYLSKNEINFEEMKRTKASLENLKSTL